MSKTRGGDAAAHVPATPRRAGPADDGSQVAGRHQRQWPPFDRGSEAIDHRTGAVDE
ncbi:hypothetical protein [Salinigranum salinum]|uniref:hypothetical protein n=1 Tax=Salinigranum salinum TaxID=1364937 RepID=UPI001863C106|nr:hypothetical protein [Salinigranum salinum]